ncbi:TetR/AcrR family transcriptional regulator [Nocardia mexicana]|uniref:TetR family transcriptional regulator n=1 Tax=Nocardia mexicana TaxID=279262 RepID=A0A370HAS2_9NOCA|nr:TetR/AcrR family transcriptional regulator [Nocardia mexicana]RDI51658.1 TetR family transcriptional regulator [Nocardia mexicana]
MPGAENVAPQRRPGGRAAKVKEAVHRAVLEAVDERGVDQVGIPDISRRAGVRDSSIYRRWGTRENLILDVMLTASERTLPLPDTGTLHGDLTAFATALIGYLDTPLGHGLARALAFIPDSEEITQARDTFWDRRYHVNKVMIERAVARGELPRGTDARVAIELLIAPIHFRHFLTRRPVDAEFADHLATLVIRALQPGTGEEDR